MTTQDCTSMQCVASHPFVVVVVVVVVVVKNRILA